MASMRQEYEMTPDDAQELVEVSRPNPGQPWTAQENANKAWAELGKRMLFDWTTVKPSAKGPLFFLAVPSPTGLPLKNPFHRAKKPKYGVPMRPGAVSMPQSYWDLCLEVGEGNLAQGIRDIIEFYQLENPDGKRPHNPGSDLCRKEERLECPAEEADGGDPVR